MADPFISRDDLGNKLGMDLSADDHALASVDAACDMCRTISEQTFNRGTTDFTLDGSGTEVLLLPEYPVGSVGTVTEAGTVIPSTDWALDTITGALIRRPTNGYVSSNTTLAPTVVWDRGKQNITVECEHGWDADEIPRDVRIVALNIAARFYQQNTAVFESLGDRSVRYEAGPSELNENELRILRKYKRER